MKRALLITVFFIIFFIIYFLQSNFFTWYNIGGIQPNLFIILVLCIGLFLGRIYGLSLGVIYGLLLDLFIGKRIGLNGITFGICGLIGGLLGKGFSRGNRISFILIIICITILSEIINYTLQIILLGAVPFFTQFMKIVLIEALYNAILVIILYPLIQKSGEKTEEIFKTTNSFMKYY